MKEQEPSKRTRKRAPKNRTTTGFRISDDTSGPSCNRCCQSMSAATGSVEDAHGCPIVTALMRFSMSYEADVNGKPLTRPNCAHIRLLMIAFKNGCKKGCFSSCGKQDRSNLKSFKGSIGAGTRMRGQKPRLHGVEEKPTKVPPTGGRAEENAVGTRPSMGCRSHGRLKKRTTKR